VFGPDAAPCSLLQLLMENLSPHDFARDWIDAFNAHDIERIMAHYAPDVELTSPLYLKFTEGRTDRLQNRQTLRAYFEAALKRYPRMRLTLHEVAAGTHSVCIRYHTSLGSRIAIECFERAPDGQVTRVTCHYVS